MVLWPSLVVLWMRGWGEGDTDPEGLSASQWSCCPWVSVKQGEMGSHHLPAGFQPCPMARGSLVKSQWGVVGCPKTVPSLLAEPAGAVSHKGDPGLAVPSSQSLLCVVPCKCGVLLSGHCGSWGGQARTLPSLITHVPA